MINSVNVPPPPPLPTVNYGSNTAKNIGINTKDVVETTKPVEIATPVRTTDSDSFDIDYRGQNVLPSSKTYTAEKPMGKTPMPPTPPTPPTPIAQTVSMQTPTSNIDKMAMMHKASEQPAVVGDFKKMSSGLYSNGDNTFGKLHNGEMIFRGFKI